jgi:SPP1 gp7 family putative phage head morphogenesis protein
MEAVAIRPAGRVAPQERREARVQDQDKSRVLQRGVALAAQIGFRAQLAAVTALKAGRDPIAPARAEIMRATPILAGATLEGFLTGQRRAITLAQEHAPAALALRKAAYLDSGYKYAVHALVKRLGTPQRTLDDLAEKHHAEALRVVKGAADHVEKKLQQAIADITAKGLHKREGIKELTRAFEAAGLTPAHSFTIEAIFRTQTAMAYGAGRWELENTPELEEILWGYKYVTVGDDRVRPAHVGLEGVQLPKDHPFWQTGYPPNGWACRCVAIAVYEERREVPPPDSILVDGKQVKPGPDKGFQMNPGTVFRAVKPPKGGGPLVPPPPGPRPAPEPEPEPPPPPRKPQRPKRPRAPKPKPQEPPVERVKKPRVAKTVKEAERIARDLDVADAVDFTGLSLETANAVNQSIAEHAELFPELRANFKFVGSIQRQNRYIIEKKAEEMEAAMRRRGASDDDIRYWKPAFIQGLKRRLGRVRSDVLAHSVEAQHLGGDVASGIQFNEHWFKPSRQEALKIQLERDAASGFHPAGTGTAKAIVDHELGHQVDGILGLASRTEFLDPELKQIVADHVPMPVDAVTKVSRYAATNPKELVAEAWAEYRNSPQPREVARLIGELIERKAKERRNRT